MIFVLHNIKLTAFCLEFLSLLMTMKFLKFYSRERGGGEGLLVMAFVFFLPDNECYNF